MLEGRDGEEGAEEDMGLVTGGRTGAGAGAVKCHCVTAPAAQRLHFSLALVLACSESKTGEAAAESRLSSEMTGGGLPALFASCL